MFDGYKDNKKNKTTMRPEVYYAGTLLCYDREQFLKHIIT
jgi:hypothetical protein